MQHLTVDHKTTYRYSKAVEFGEHRLMFRPRDSHDLRLLDARLTISPTAEVRWLHDVFGNSVAAASFAEPADELYFQSIIVIERYPLIAPEFAIEPFARTLPFSYPAREVPDLGRTIERHYSDPKRVVTEWARRFLNADGMTDTEDFLIAVTGAIKSEFRYEERYEPGVQSPVETLSRSAGTCRDYALFMMEAVRSVGLATRFVSGYLYDPSIDGTQSEIQAPAPPTPGSRSICRAPGGLSLIPPMAPMAGTTLCRSQWRANRPRRCLYRGLMTDRARISSKCLSRSAFVASRSSEILPEMQLRERS